jgi:hypothetical protein
MPNHVENDLTITGDKKELERFKQKARGKYPWADSDNETDPKIEMLCCNSFIPAPKEAIKDYGKFGYHWCIKNWGTKWGCYETELEERDGELFYTFQSAWSPIVPVVKKMAQVFPKLTFDYRYYEGGMGFHGVLRIEQGKVVAEKCCDYVGSRGG